MSPLLVRAGACLLLLAACARGPQEGQASVPLDLSTVPALGPSPAPDRRTPGPASRGPSAPAAPDDAALAAVAGFERYLAGTYGGDHPAPWYADLLDVRIEGQAVVGVTDLRQDREGAQDAPAVCQVLSVFALEQDLPEVLVVGVGSAVLAFRDVAADPSGGCDPAFQARG